MNLFFFLQLGFARCMDLAIEMDLSVNANPIRKVVTLMQDMQKEIEEEGAKEKELFDKFKCYCSSNGGDMSKTITDLEAKVDDLGASLKADESEKTQTDVELAKHKEDREAASEDLQQGMTLREKDKSEFQAEKADSETNIKALSTAIPAIQRGMGGDALLQMPWAPRLKNLISSYPAVDAVGRHTVVSFLEASSDDEFAPSSAQIVGILKGIKDDMEANLKTAVEDEDKDVKGFADLKASKEKEISMATAAIEKKTELAGTLAVSVVQTKDALDDAMAELADTKKFAAQLKSQCASKEKEWAERSQLRSEEIAAVSESISILNDDDSLEIFKETMPSSLLQKGVVAFWQQSHHKASRSTKAQAILMGIVQKSTPLRLMLFTLNSQIKMRHAAGFSDVIKMIDDMLVLLAKQQTDDDKHKAWCEDELEKSGNEEQVTNTKLSEAHARIDEMTDAITTLMEEISTLTKKVADLDDAVAEATEQRKEDHAQYVKSASLNQAAIGLVGKAKSRMQKFYNPTLVATSLAEKQKDVMQTEMQDVASFVEVRSHKTDVAPPPAPQTFGEYTKGAKSAGILGMLDSIIKDLKNDLRESEFEEKSAQKEYSELMSDSQATRAQDVKSITDKESAKAELESKMTSAKQTRAATVDDLSIVQATIKDLHKSCDFLMGNFDLRKESRTAEIESLKNAKFVLSGASFGF